MMKESYRELLRNWGEKPSFKKVQGNNLFLEFSGRESGIRYQERFAISPTGEVDRLDNWRGDTRFE